MPDTTGNNNNTPSTNSSTTPIPKQSNNNSNPNISPTTAPTSSPSGKKTSNTTSLPPNSIDTHPYARGSIIEVLWNGKKKTTQTRRRSSFSSSSSSSDDESSVKPAKPQIRLCDVIDRAHFSSQWQYYVHYRDFNRRMDEWIPSDRILSPPSIGAAKAKALQKKEEEDTKRKKRRREEERQKRMLAKEGMMEGGGGGGGEEGDLLAGQRLTRRQKRKTREEDGGGGVGGEKCQGGQQMGVDVVATLPPQELDEHEGLDEASLREHEEVTKVKNVSEVEIGPYRMETWYFSPIPKEYTENGIVDVLFVCEFTLNFFTNKSELLRFQRKPGLRRHPPGNEIYRKRNLSMFEIDGYEERIYCQNLCYIAKLFLDHKTLYFDVDPFLFYVLCEVDERGFHPVGYFSKEKYSDVGYNLACILTFPSHQRKGYGRFLISFSYELSKKEEKVGSPEKPMSDLGQQAYKPYWASTIIDFLYHNPHESSMSIMDISKKTSIMAEDIIFTLNQLGILKLINGVYFIAAEQGLLEMLRKKHPVKEPRVDPSLLHWTSFLTDVKRDKFSIHSKKPSVEDEEGRGTGGF